MLYTVLHNPGGDLRNTRTRSCFLICCLMSMLIPPLQTYEARLWGLHNDRRENWQEMCNTTPATINNVHFDRPTRCYQDRVSFLTWVLPRCYCPITDTLPTLSTACVGTLNMKIRTAPGATSMMRHLMSRTSLSLNPPPESALCSVVRVRVGLCILQTSSFLASFVPQIVLIPVSS